MMMQTTKTTIQQPCLKCYHPSVALLLLLVLALLPVFALLLFCLRPLTLTKP